MNIQPLVFLARSNKNKLTVTKKAFIFENPVGEKTLLLRERYSLAPNPIFYHWHNCFYNAIFYDSRLLGASLSDFRGTTCVGLERGMEVERVWMRWGGLGK